MTKFIFVSGGVCSSLGKGVAASSLGALLESRGFNTRMVKCDPYINVNAGTMSPFVHGEIYVTDDGAETDLDLGNYARFTSGMINKANSMTTGQVYKSVMEKERTGGYNGRCIQVIPHVTDEIKNRIMKAAYEDNETDIVIIEIGGTVGDIESIPFLEAARQIIHEQGRVNAISVHLTLVPELSDGELKTKPTQHSVKAMQETGIQPDVLICRAPVMLDEDTRSKIAQFTNVDLNAVITCRDAKNTIYEIPLMFFEQKLDQVVLNKLGATSRHANLKPWHSVLEQFRLRRGEVRIGIAGKYFDIQDAYKSVYEALFHAGLECGVDVKIIKIDPAALEKSDADLEGASIDGLLVHGAFGEKKIDGMIQAAAWARANKVPYFGIYLGMQAMVIEWCRNVMNVAGADSAEFNPKTKYPVISLIESSGEELIKLGAFESAALPETKISAAYGTEQYFYERHRRCSEVSEKYLSDIESSGLIISARSADGSTVDSVEWPDHPWGVGVQFHPEFKSKPTAAAPLFRDFIAAANKNKNKE